MPPPTACRWKGLTWGMLPFHSSGLCAVTYHFFYNAKAIEPLIAIQGALTVFGDLTCWYAAYRVFRYAMENPDEVIKPAPSPELGMNTQGFLPDLSGGEGAYLSSLFVLVMGMSAAVKWGELYAGLPFDPQMGTALCIIGVLSLANIGTWMSRSSRGSTEFNEFY